MRWSLEDEMLHIVESIEIGEFEMYHDSQGREIEDLEGDNMRRDARQASAHSQRNGAIAMKEEITVGIRVTVNGAYAGHPATVIELGTRRDGREGEALIQFDNATGIFQTQWFEFERLTVIEK